MIIEILSVLVGAVCLFCLATQCCARRRKIKELEKTLKEVLEGNRIVHITNHVYHFEGAQRKKESQRIKFAYRPMTPTTNHH